MARADLPLTALATTSALAFAALARGAHRRPDNAVDARAREAVLAQSGARARRAYAPLKQLGKWYTLVPLTLAGAGALAWSRARGRGGSVRRAAAAGGPLALAALLGAALAEGTEAFLPSRPPPPGRHKPEEPSFPSGHSLQPAAVALTAGWVLWREGLLPGALAAPAAAGVPLLFGAVQLPGERHWLTDVLGGWLAGLAVAAGCAALYERAAGRR